MGAVGGSMVGEVVDVSVSSVVMLSYSSVSVVMVGQSMFMVGGTAVLSVGV